MIAIIAMSSGISCNRRVFLFHPCGSLHRENRRWWWATIILSWNKRLEVSASVQPILVAWSGEGLPEQCLPAYTRHQVAIPALSIAGHQSRMRAVADRGI